MKNTDSGIIGTKIVLSSIKTNDIHHLCDFFSKPYFRLRRLVAPEDIQDIDTPDPSPLLDDMVTNSLAVEKALDKLSVPQREAVVLHYFHQFTVREIAHMTHTPLPTVKSRLASAKRLLEKSLKEDS